MNSFIKQKQHFEEIQNTFDSSFLYQQLIVNLLAIPCGGNLKLIDRSLWYEENRLVPERDIALYNELL